MEYEVRTTAFIDILGFKDLVNKTSSLKDIHDALQTLYQIKGRKEKSIVEEDYIKSLQIGMFSDSIVLSCQPEYDYYLFLDALDIQIKLMLKGIFIRGCVSIGNLFHNDNLVFGPALIKAYKGETTMAKYPRIIIDETNRYEGTVFCKDFDGVMFLDFMRELSDKHWNENLDLDNSVRTIYQHVHNSINGQIEFSIQSKFEWLKRVLDEVFYLNDGKYNYFSFSTSTYDRSESFSSTRMKLIEVLKAKNKSAD